MSDLLNQLRSAAGYQHDDLSVCGEAADRIEQLEAALRKAQEALEPFAEASENLESDTPDNYGVDSSMAISDILVKDLRHSRAAHAEIEKVLK